MDTSNKSYPKSGTAKRTALGSLMNVIGYGIKSLEKIIFIPLFLWAWSKALYGEWMTLFSIVGYLSVSDLGMGNYVKNKMTQAYSKSNLEEYIKTFKSALGVYSLISLGLLLLLALFAFSAPFLKWFNIELASEMSVRFSVFILGAYIVLGTISSLVSSFYNTTGEFPRAKLISNIRQILLIGFIAVVLVSGGQFIAVSLVYLALLFLYTLFVFFDTTKRHPEIDLKKSEIDWKMGLSFIAPGLIYMLIPLSNMIYLQGGVLIISSILGSVAVATFTVHRTLANLIHSFSSFINPAIQPELTAGEARGEYSKIQLIHQFFIKVIIFISTALATFLLFNGGNIINIWTGGEIAFNPTLWALFLALIPVLAVWNFSSTFQVAVNKYGKFAISRIITTVLGLILAIFLGKSMGLTGVLLGFLISEVLIDFWYIPYNTLNIIKDSKKNFIISVLGGLPMIGLQLISGWFVSTVFTNPWLKILFTGATVGIIGASYTYFIWFNKKEKKTADDFIKKVKNKFIK